MNIRNTFIKNEDDDIKALNEFFCDIYVYTNIKLN